MDSRLQSHAVAQGSTRTERAPDNGETAKFMQRVARGNPEDDEEVCSTEGSLTPHDLSRQGAQNEEDACM